MPVLRGQAMNCPQCTGRGLVAPDEDGDMHCSMCGWTEPLSDDRRRELEALRAVQRRRRPDQP